MSVRWAVKRRNNVEIDDPAEFQLRLGDAFARTMLVPFDIHDFSESSIRQGMTKKDYKSECKKVDKKWRNAKMYKIRIKSTLAALSFLPRMIYVWGFVFFSCFMRCVLLPAEIAVTQSFYNGMVQQFVDIAASQPGKQRWKYQLRADVCFTQFLIHKRVVVVCSQFKDRNFVCGFTGWTVEGFKWWKLSDEYKKLQQKKDSDASDAPPREESESKPDMRATEVIEEDVNEEDDGFEDDGRMPGMIDDSEDESSEPAPPPPQPKKTKKTKKPKKRPRRSSNGSPSKPPASTRRGIFFYHAFCFCFCFVLFCDCVERRKKNPAAPKVLSLEDESTDEMDIDEGDVATPMEICDKDGGRVDVGDDTDVVEGDSEATEDEDLEVCNGRIGDLKIDGKAFEVPSEKEFDVENSESKDEESSTSSSFVFCGIWVRCVICFVIRSPDVDYAISIHIHSRRIR